MNNKPDGDTEILNWIESVGARINWIGAIWPEPFCVEVDHRGINRKWSATGANLRQAIGRCRENIVKVPDGTDIA